MSLFQPCLNICDFIESEESFAYPASPCSDTSEDVYEEKGGSTASKDSSNWWNQFSEKPNTLPVATPKRSKKQVSADDIAIGVMSPIAKVVKSAYKNSEVKSFRKEGYNFSCELLAAGKTAIAYEIEDMIEKDLIEKLGSELDKDDIEVKELLNTSEPCETEDGLETVSLESTPLNTEALMFISAIWIIFFIIFVKMILNIPEISSEFSLPEPLNIQGDIFEIQDPESKITATFASNIIETFLVTKSELENAIFNL